MCAICLETASEGATDHLKRPHRMLRHEALERCFRETGEVSVAEGHHGRTSGLVCDNGHLADDLAGADLGNTAFFAARGCPCHTHATVDHDTEVVARVAFPEQHLA